MKKTTVFARVVASMAVALSMLAAMSPARAEDPLPPLPVSTGSPSPTPSATPTARATNTPQTKPKGKPPAKPPKGPTIRTTQPKGPSPTIYSGPIADALAYWRDRPKTPSRTTTELLDLLQRLQPSGAPLDQAAIARGVYRFPIAGYTWYQDDWAAPRYLPYFHMHEGTDLFAADGTPVVACADGVIAKMMVGSIGGVAIWLRDDAGTVFYYGHLRTYAPGLKEGLRVRIGQVIATVGNTGIAVDTYPHVHFEVHPNGGAAINAKPTLDGWLTEAETRAKAAIKRGASLTSQAKIGAARWRSLFGLLAEPTAPSTAYWKHVFEPAPSGFADLALDRIALEIDWADEAKRMAEQLDQGNKKLARSPVLDDEGLLAGSAHGSG